MIEGKPNPLPIRGAAEVLGAAEAPAYPRWAAWRITLRCITELPQKEALGRLAPNSGLPQDDQGTAEYGHSSPHGHGMLGTFQPKLMRARVQRVPERNSPRMRPSMKGLRRR